jgi:hypothetical protein
MKKAIVYRDPETGRLGYRVREGQKTLQEEISTHTDIRKLRRQLRRTIGKSLVMDGLGK